MAVARPATDALARPGTLLVQHDAQRHMEGAEAQPRQIVGELLDPRLVAARWMRVGRAGRRVGGIHAAIAVQVVEVLGLGVVGLEVLVGQRPRGREPAVVADFSEVLPAEAEERRPVELRVSTYVVVGVGVERLAALVTPHLFGLVLALDVPRAGAPVVLFARHVVAALEQQDGPARGGQAPGQRPAPGPGPDDDDVVVRSEEHTSELQSLAYIVCRLLLEK